MRGVCGSERSVIAAMIRWQARFVRLGLVLGAIAAFAVAASAGQRWS
jgi:hypothetical protein